MTVRRWDFAECEDAQMWAFDNGRWVKYEEAAAALAAKDARIAELEEQAAQRSADRFLEELSERESMTRDEIALRFALQFTSMPDEYAFFGHPKKTAEDAFRMADAFIEESLPVPGCGDGIDIAPPPAGPEETA